MQLLRTLARGGVTPVTRRTIRVAPPAVATGWTLKPQAGRAWEVLSITTSLVADANVANRIVQLGLLDGVNGLWAISANAVQVAGGTVIYSFIAGYPTPTTTALGGAMAAPLPPVILLPDWSLELAIGAVQVGDQLGVSYVQVLESFVGETEADLDIARAIEHRATAFDAALHGEVSGA